MSHPRVRTDSEVHASLRISVSRGCRRSAGSSGSNAQDLRRLLRRGALGHQQTVEANLSGHHSPLAMVGDRVPGSRARCRRPQTRRPGGPRPCRRASRPPGAQLDRCGSAAQRVQFAAGPRLRRAVVRAGVRRMGAPRSAVAAPGGAASGPLSSRPRPHTFTGGPPATGNERRQHQWACSWALPESPWRMRGTRRSRHAR